MASIPADPSLVLGMLIDPSKIDTLTEISRAQQPAIMAMDYLNSLTLSYYKVDSVSRQLTNMKAPEKTLDELKEHKQTLKNEISMAAMSYAKSVMKSETKVNEIIAKSNSSGISMASESPVDFQLSNVADPFPFSYDSIKLDVQYFRSERAHANTVSAFVQNSLSGMGSSNDEVQQHGRDAYTSTSQQSSNHSLEGTIVIVASCTHKNATVLNIVLDPDKAVSAWNSMTGDYLDTNNPKKLYKIAMSKSSSKKNLHVLSGCTRGSSFVGYVHVMRRKSNNDPNDGGIELDAPPTFRSGGGEGGADSQKDDEAADFEKEEEEAEPEGNEEGGNEDGKDDKKKKGEGKGIGGLLKDAKGALGKAKGAVKDVKDKAAGVVKDVKESVENVKDQVKDTVKDVKKSVEDVKGQVKDTIKDVKASVEDVKGQVTDAVKDAKESVDKVAGTGNEEKPEAKKEEKPEAKKEEKPGAKPEAKPEPKKEEKPEAKPEPKKEEKPEAKPEPKKEEKPEPKKEEKPEPKKEEKPEPKKEEKREEGREEKPEGGKEEKHKEGEEKKDKDKENPEHESLAKLIKKKAEEQMYKRAMTGDFGAGDLTSTTQASKIDCHCSLTCMGLIPSIKSEEVNNSLMALKPSMKDLMSQLSTLQNNSKTGGDDPTGGNAKMGAQFMNMNNNFTNNALNSMADSAAEKDKIIGMDSLMTAFQDYLDKATASKGAVGVPINFYITEITKQEVAKVYIQKYYSDYADPVGAAKKKIEDFKANVEKKIEDTKASVENKVDEIKSSVENKADEIKSKLEDTKASIEQKGEEFKEKMQSKFGKGEGDDGGDE